MDAVIFLLKILGSLGIFLYGMKVMSEGIQRTAGDRMRRVMEHMTRNRLAAVGTGLLVTAMVQSSSASTVMVVSFVNAGLLTLVESIGVIMGANLGTTLTAWIIALVGKFSLSAVAIPVIGIALPVFFIAKGRLKSFGEGMIGFGLLFYGLFLLKESVPDVHSMLESGDIVIQERAEHMLNFIGGLSGHGYLSILVFLVIGIVLTLVVQSSSAAMAITITLAIQGWIGFEESAAIVLGENIGTTVTAWLASIGTSVNARRAARAHFLFNMVGILWVLAVFPFFIDGVEFAARLLPDSVRAGNHDSDIGFQLALFHSLFNLANIVFLIGFVPRIAALVTRWIRDPESDRQPRRLPFISQNMVQVGELNLPEAEKATLDLARITREMFQEYQIIFKSRGAELDQRAERLKELEDEADILTHDITEYLVRVSASEISPENARAVTRMLRIASELEEVSDAIYRLGQITRRKQAKNRIFTAEAVENVQSFSDKITELIDLYVEVIEHGADDASLERAEEIERETDKMRKQHNKHAMKRMRSNGDQIKEEVKTEMSVIDMNNQLEMIANYGLNVVQTAFYLLHEDEVPDKYAAPAM